MGLMVYATIGRTAIYQMQDLLRLINSGEQTVQGKIDNAKVLMEQLPQSNWFKMSEKLIPAEHITHGDAGIYDMFLHQQDRAYTVGELFEYIDQCGLEFVDFSYQRTWRYRPESYLSDNVFLQKIERMDVRRQYEIAELIAGNILMHVFYVSSKKAPSARLSDLDNIPFFYLFQLDTEALYRNMLNSPGQSVILCPTPNIKLSINPGKYTHLVFKYLDGKRSLRKIFRKIKKDLGKSSVTDAELLSDFEPVYKVLNDADWLLLRSQAAKPVRDFDQMQEEVSRQYRDA
jgi:hypothetical protein